MSKLFNLIQKNVEQKIGLLDIGFLRNKDIYNRKSEHGLTQIIRFWGYERHGEYRLQMIYGVRVSEIAKENFQGAEDDSSESFFDAANIGGQCKSSQEKYRAYYGVTEDNHLEIIEDICAIIKKQVLPMFADFETRDKITLNIHKYYPERMHQLLALFYINGAKGDHKSAKKIIDEYFTEVVDKFEKGDIHVKNGIPRLYGVVKKNSIDVDAKIIEKYNSLMIKFLEERGLKDKKTLKEMLL